MKKIIFLFVVVSGFILLPGCGNFGDLNKNPVQPTSLNPVYLLATAELGTSYGTQNLVYESILVQQTYTPFGGVLAGGNFNQDNRNNTNADWNQYYENGVKVLTDVIDKTKNDASRTNLYQMARIWRALVFQILTDTYGDIPYSEAGLGYLKGLQTPKYDTQESIYTDIIKELTEASAALDASKTIEKGDLIYNGDVSKWKKLGNSLLLRAGLRLVKVNPALAQSTVAKAVQGGVFQSNADNAILKHTSTYNNPIATTLNSTEKANYYLNDTFVNYLQQTADPRLKVIAVKYGDATQSLDKVGTENTNPAQQQGMPNGYDDGTIKNAPNFPGSYTKYSQLNRRTIANILAPAYFITYSQVSLLLAEAAQRGWVPGDVQALYKAGVTAHFKQMAEYDAVIGNIPQADIDAYFVANPFDASKALEQINTQYWVSCLMNAGEAWANLRRTGYPNFLVANTYPSQDVTPKGSLVRRLTYPINETSLNKANLTDAIARQGADNLNTRVWWDK